MQATTSRHARDHALVGPKILAKIYSENSCTDRVRAFVKTPTHFDSGLPFRKWIIANRIRPKMALHSLGRLHGLKLFHSYYFTHYLIKYQYNFSFSFLFFVCCEIKGAFDTGDCFGEEYFQVHHGSYSCSFFSFFCKDVHVALQSVALCEVILSMSVVLRKCCQGIVHPELLTLITSS